jgi:hypothetical protein
MSRSDILFQSIKNFYADEKNAQHLCDILEKHKGISLRKLEWFITDYSKKRNLSYTMTDGKAFSVHCAYKSSLDGYSKKLFDPFCRTEKFEYEIPHTKGAKIQTTVAQLNFIKWCIQHDIIDYITTQSLTKQDRCCTSPC